MRIIVLATIVTALISCSSGLTPIEHGMRGKYLTAQRMISDTGTRNIQITENKFYGDIDRVEIGDIIESNGGFVLCGDFTGLHIVLFKGMDTKAKQDSVILSVLPQLENWYRSEHWYLFSELSP
jgi:hypothetical protein